MSKNCRSSKNYDRIGDIISIIDYHDFASVIAESNFYDDRLYRHILEGEREGNISGNPDFVLLPFYLGNNCVTRIVDV